MQLLDPESFKANDTDKEPWLDQFLCSIPGPLRSVVDAVHDEVTWAEHRTRARRTKDAESFRLVVDVLVSNLVVGFLRHPEPRPIVVSQDPNRSPTVYDNKALPHRTMRKNLGLLEASGYLTQTPGSYTPRRHPTISIAPGLVRLVEEHGVDLSCFGRLDGDPLLILSTKIDRGHHRKPKTKLVSYPWTQETSDLSARVAQLNDFLARADLQFIHDGGDEVATGDRTLRRHFSILLGQSIRFDQVGRLYGGFWLNLKRHRRHGLRIDGEPIADLDFSSMHPRLAYHFLGEDCPEGDLYDLTGLLPGYDNAEPDQRDAVKQGLCSLFNGGRAGAASGQPSHLDDLPEGTTAANLREALSLKHPGLVSIIEPARPRKTPLGYELMMVESDILLNALDHLMSLGVVALPSHDGLFVAQSKQEIAQEAMEAASKAILGTSLPVKLKASPEPTSAILRTIHV